MSAALEVLDLATGYGDLRAVLDVNLRVETGTITVLLGRNGAGKTTTLRAIAGLNPTSSGRISLHGTDLAGMPAHQRARRGIGYVQEGKRVFKSRTVEENLLLGMYARPASNRARADASDLLDAAYTQFPILASRRRTPAAQLSGGQQQMLAIAQALAAEPTVLLLDEPSAGLAPSVVGEMLATIAQLRERGLAVLLVEQAMEFALALADRVVVIDLGRQVYAGAADEADVRQAVRDAYLGLAQAAAVAASPGGSPVESGEPTRAGWLRKWRRS